MTTELEAEIRDFLEEIASEEVRDAVREVAGCTLAIIGVVLQMRAKELLAALESQRRH